MIAESCTRSDRHSTSLEMEPVMDGERARLEQAFAAFSEMSRQLSDSYQSLARRAVSLNDELARANDARLEELATKETLANRLSRLLEALPAGVVVLDGEGRVRDSNPAAATLLGTTPDGQDWRDVIRHAFSPKPDDGHDVSLASGRRVNVQTCSLGNEPGQIVLLNDVTETRALHEQLSRHQRLTAMGEMAASLAHQIRTPLATAMLYASHMTARVLPASDQARYADRISASLRHLEKLVNDMLVFARGGGAIKESLAVGSLLVDLIGLTGSAIQPAGIRLEAVDAAGSSAVYGNREALLGALQNLIINAAQAAGTGGAIQVCAQRAGSDSIEIQVSDNGPGVPEELRERIFDPFFTTRAQGTGLGLAVVHAVARAHQGTVRVMPRDGGGSTFVLRLPLFENNEQSDHNEVFHG
jgi:two-component system sensor histidine kinase FlrB